VPEIPVIVRHESPAWQRVASVVQSSAQTFVLATAVQNVPVSQSESAVHRARAQ
jgi:hypothetical protein